MAATSALLLAGCTGDTGGAASQERTRAVRQPLISDQLHNGGTTGFVFLPPMVPAPAYFGDFLPDLEPTVRIDEVRPDGTTIRTLATFTRDSGPGCERIRVHRQGEACDSDDDDGDTDPNGYFYARWKTHNAHLSPSGLYRVRVFVQERVHPCTRNGWGRRCRHGEDNTSPMREIGFADVDVVRNSREFRGVDRAELVPLINGQVLRIKFRIDRPVVDADGDGVYNWRDNCRDTANASQLDTNHDGQGDACECLGVTCAPSDACHAAGTCSPTNGMCSNPAAPDGTACSLANAAAACTAGSCGVSACHAGFANCNGAPGDGCETPTNTLANCGGCGVACAVGAHASPTCATGACALVCDAGWADCDGDLANGCEQNVATDGDHCGACGNVCTQGRTCVSGGCSATVCTPGRANCDGDEGNGCEVTLGGDVSHCGACGNACAVANGIPMCSAGACAVAQCDPGYVDCNHVAADGCEAHVAADAANCGACGFACNVPNAAPVCAAGVCAIGACNAGYADVDGNAANGCEVNLNTDSSHCGSVGNACSAPYGTAACVAGVCAVQGCDLGRADCDGVAGNGCEIDLRDDAANCGACGTSCPSGANGAGVCGAGVCGLTCDAGFVNCDGNAANGCEVNVLSDGANCGACGLSCTAGRTCQAGACTAAVCTAGLANCDGVETNGCEVTLATDPAHCGGCGVVCSFANAAPECTAGVCGFSVCNVGFADVDGNPANGCEVNLNTDLNHCGAVGHACPAVANGVASCAAGVCGAASCNVGFDLVSGACVNHDDCAPNPCQNGGLCTDGLSAFTCACAEGFSGPTCGTASCGHVAQLASGQAPSHVIRQGRLFGFGANTFGRLGTGDTNDRNAEFAVDADTTWKQVSSGWFHGAAVRLDGSLWTWGRNNRGALGHGDTVDRLVPTRVGTGNDWAVVSAGIDLTVAVKTDGTLWAWGANTNGQLCMTGSADRLVPTQVGTDNTWSRANRDVLSAVYHGIMAIRTDGSLWGCGKNEAGALGVGHTSPVATMTREATNGTNWVRVYTHNRNSAAIRADGTLWTTGANDYSQLGRSCAVVPCQRFGQESTGATNWTRAGYGGFHLNAVRGDGTLWSVGYDDQGVLWRGVIASQSTWAQSPGTGFIDLGVWYYASIALKNDGSRWGTGANTGPTHNLALGVGSTAARVVSDGATGLSSPVNPTSCQP